MATTYFRSQTAVDFFACFATIVLMVQPAEPKWGVGQEFCECRGEHCTVVIDTECH